ncbi:MAG: DUF4234 domain-containing protein [Oscillospiraceae bacterium]|nr:DUF4234 domain-containing protein [Oscillospiraceae bacterium]
MKTRSVGLAILLFFITGGLYGLYWFIVLSDDINELADPPEKTSGGMALLYTLLTCGIYGIYWYYKWGKLLDTACERRGIYDKNYSTTCLLLGIFGLGIISWAIMQNSVNDLIEMRPVSRNNNFETKAGVKIAVISGSSGIYKGQSFEIEDGSEIVFGRDSSVCNIIFPNSEVSVSRKHCSIKYIGISDTFLVTNYSKNGVMYDGNHRIEAGSSAMLHRGTVISLGTVSNQFILG